MEETICQDTPYTYEHNMSISPFICLSLSALLFCLGSFHSTGQKSVRETVINSIPNVE